MYFKTWPKFGLSSLNKDRRECRFRVFLVTHRTNRPT